MSAIPGIWEFFWGYNALTFYELSELGEECHLTLHLPPLPHIERCAQGLPAHSVTEVRFRKVVRALS